MYLAEVDGLLLSCFVSEVGWDQNGFSAERWKHVDVEKQLKVTGL